VLWTTHLHARAKAARHDLEFGSTAHKGLPARPRRWLSVWRFLRARMLAQHMPMTVAKQMDMIQRRRSPPSCKCLCCSETALDNGHVRQHLGCKPTNNTLPPPISVSMTDRRTAPCLIENRELSQAPVRCYHRPLYEFASARQCVNRPIMRVATCPHMSRSPIHGNMHMNCISTSDG
jgi:hypothetical protein